MSDESTRSHSSSLSRSLSLSALRTLHIVSYTALCSIIRTLHRQCASADLRGWEATGSERERNELFFLSNFLYFFEFLVRSYLAHTFYLSGSIAWWYCDVLNAIGGGARGGGRGDDFCSLRHAHTTQIQVEHGGVDVEKINFIRLSGDQHKLSTMIVREHQQQQQRGKKIDIDIIFASSHNRKRKQQSNGAPSSHDHDRIESVQRLMCEDHREFISRSASSLMFLPLLPTLTLIIRTPCNRIYFDCVVVLMRGIGTHDQSSNSPVVSLFDLYSFALLIRYATYSSLEVEV